MNMMEIGAAIRTARQQRNLSQEQLGKSLGMSRATISGIETGKINEVGLRKIMALCASLGLELYAEQRRRYPTLQQLQQENREQKR